MDGVNGSFWEEGLLNNYPIAIEPEVMYENYQYLSYDVMSWGYWTNTGPIVGLNPIVPKVSTYKAMTKGMYINFLHVTLSNFINTLGYLVGHPNAN